MFIFDPAFTQPLVTYTYDENGDRTSMADYNTDYSPKLTTFYVHDASGNVVAIYTNTVQTEIPFYGIGRLGTYTVSGGSYVYKLRNNVGSVRVVVSAAPKGQDIVNYNDYYPFGALAQSSQAYANGGVET